MTKDEMLLGGPGLDGYAYRGDVYCIRCGQNIIADGPDEIPEGDARFSGITPQPIFFGESDTTQYCAECGEYLYGPEGGEEEE